MARCSQGRFKSTHFGQEQKTVGGVFCCKVPALCTPKEVPSFDHRLEAVTFHAVRTSNWINCIHGGEVYTCLEHPFISHSIYASVGRRY